MGGGGILPPESKVIICSLESSRVLIVTRAPELDGPLSAVLARDGDGRILDEYLGLGSGG